MYELRTKYYDDIVRLSLRISDIHISKINKFIISKGKTEIDWQP